MSGANNEARVKAENEIKHLRQFNARDLFAQLSMFIHSTSSNVISTQKLLACILLKKFYLDERPEEKDFEQITLSDV